MQLLMIDTSLHNYGKYPGFWQSVNVYVKFVHMRLRYLIHTCNSPSPDGTPETRGRRVVYMHSFRSLRFYAFIPCL